MSSSSNSSSSSSSSDNTLDEFYNSFLQFNQSIDQKRQAYHNIENQIFSSLTPLLSPTIELPIQHKRYIYRDREDAHSRLISDYFAPNATYSAYFRRRFRMQKHVFVRIMEALSASNVFFQQRPDATGRLGLSVEQKCTAAIRMLAYGVAADMVDEYLKLGQSTARQCLLNFVEGVINQFGDEYLRRPNVYDMQRLLEDGRRRGFPGMMGSIDCMHWEWKNCPRAWKGQFQGRNKKATLILEAVASRDLWIWHAFFGMPGSCNDINVLDRSPVFDDILNGEAPSVSYVVNGNDYHMGYYLTDSIYPKWAAFMPSIAAPQTAKHKLFAEHQEGARKDVERAFGVLQARFAIIRHPSLSWDRGVLGKIMKACIIMHNMIVEDERANPDHGCTEEFNEDNRQYQASSSNTDMDNTGSTNYSAQPTQLLTYMDRRTRVRDRQIHITLKNDLVEHIWQKFSDN